jgi:hypothetical protein
MTGIQAFSDWVLAALPRLFHYPGGLWLLGSLLVLRAASGGLGAIRLDTFARDFLSARPLSLVLGWVAVAMLPLPGATDLPVPPDRLVLVTLPLLSLAVTAIQGGETRRKLWTAVGVTLALLVPLVGGNSLFVREGYWSVAAVLVMLAVAVGLVSLWQEARRDMAAAARWLAWLGLGMSPLLEWREAPFAGVVWVGGVYLLLVLTLAFSARFVMRHVGQGLPAVVAGALSLGAVVLALVVY